MNYGYECRGWPTATKKLLAEELRKMIGNLIKTHNLDVRKFQMEVEVDGVYDGVRIRRLPWENIMNDAVLSEMCDKADHLYLVLQTTIK